MKRWKGLSRSGERNKVLNSFMMTLKSLCTIVRRMMVIMWKANTGNQRAHSRLIFLLYVLKYPYVN